MLRIAGKSTPAISLQNPAITLSSLFNLTKSLPLVEQLHAQIILNGLHRSVLFGSKVSNSYIEMGSLETAFEAFNQIPFKNPHSWNTIISGYLKSRRFSDVLRLYKRLRGDNCSVDSFSLVFAIKACVGLSLPQMGKSVHSDAVKSGLDIDSYVAPALMNMYIELGGTLEETHKVFERISERNSVIWGTMMKGFLKFSKEFDVFELFHQMRKTGYELDPFSVDGLIRACGNVSAGKDGNALHGYCIKRNFFESNICLQTSIVDMYMKCGLLGFGIKLFEEILDKDVVLWSTIVTGFAKNGRACEAISFFQKMLEESIMLNVMTLASVILACSHLGALQQGKSVHGFAIRNGVELDMVNYTSLIDMYAKCGSIEIARTVFNKMPERNVFSWSVMINGFGIHGLYSEAFAMFTWMRSENPVPNSVTFVSVLSACSHSGRVEEGWNYFNMMSRDYGITPIEEHYACMVDLLGRAGKTNEAELFIEKMPMEPGASVWGALLGACRIHKRVELAERVANKLLVLEPGHPGVYVLLSNIYSAAGMWEMVKKMRAVMNEKGLNKIIGFSSIAIENKVYAFGANDTQAHKNRGIKHVWSVLCEHMRTFGYVTDSSFDIADMDDEVEEMLSGNSEKLAIASGLLNTSRGANEDHSELESLQ